ncbi:MAG: NAD-dependent epimerase/dehydratase family protein [Proteobacteria bacterium]|nr:NAD-dependent epimerase/dehydratase family protein [Pseudomonadota bacterium]MCP4916422.1 NAD-dependent epimerase/dehydratase family protein [Pseudomonadota bacterium]
MILVTGATGQIGSRVAKALVDRGEAVRCLVRNPARRGALDFEAHVVPGDIQDLAAVDAAMQGVRRVVHCAGVVSYWQKNAQWQRDVNVGGTRNVLDAAAKAGVERVLLTSSIAALGAVPGDGLGDEATPWNWRGVPYAETKREAQDLVLADTRVEGVAVNPGITFGTHDLHRNAGRMCLQVAGGGPPGVPSGATTVAALDDVVEGHLAALDCGRAGQSYVLGGHTPSFVELFAAVAQVVGGRAPTRVLPAWLVALYGQALLIGAAFSGNEPPITPVLARVSAANRRYSSAKAIGELGYAPKPLEHGIRQCWDWYGERGIR